MRKYTIDIRRGAHPQGNGIYFFPAIPVMVAHFFAEKPQKNRAIRSNSSKPPMRFLRDFRYYPLRAHGISLCANSFLIVELNDVALAHPPKPDTIPASLRAAGNAWGRTPSAFAGHRAPACPEQPERKAPRLREASK